MYPIQRLYSVYQDSFGVSTLGEVNWMLCTTLYVAHPMSVYQHSERRQDVSDWA